MIQYERLQYIMDLAKKKKFVSVEDITRKLNVSAMTVRRDINLLCSQGQLERCYGGARVPQEMMPEIQYDEKLNQNLEAKVRIAHKAIEFINDDEAIFLDGGTTTAQIAKLIAQNKKKTTVVTCDLAIAMILARSNCNVTIVGGTVNSLTQSVSGHAADKFLQQFRFSRAFIGASCIDYNFDTFSPNADKAHMKNLVATLSNQVYIVSDASKFYGSAMNIIASLSNFSGVITDKTFNKSEMKIIREKGINIINVKPES